MLRELAVKKINNPIRTPLIREGSIWIKSEQSQISGSAKYRMVYAKVKKAITLGEIKEDTILVEVTSGSTGLALASLGQQLGVRVEIHTFENANPEKLAKLRTYGATVILYTPDVPFGKILSNVMTKSQDPKYWHLKQFERSSITAAYQELGQEIVEQIFLDGSSLPRIFVCPVGTGGIVQGVGVCLRKAFQGIQIISVEPEPGAMIDGIRNTEKMYMGDVDPYDRNFPDHRYTVISPDKNTTIQGIRLGDSGTATYELIKSKKWENALMIAPD